MEAKNLPVPISQLPELAKTMGRDNINLLLKLLLSQEQNSHEQRMSESKERMLDKKIKLASVMKNTIQDYSETCADNKYAPMAVSSISASFAAMTGESAEIKPLDLSMFEDVKKKQKQEIEQLKTSSIPIDQRVKEAEAQGFRWNDHNIMPTNQSTVLRKIGQWEEGVRMGQECNLEEVVMREYDELLKKNSKAYVVGVCIALEQEMEISKQLSPYLKRRFNTLQQIYQERNQVITVKAVSVEDQVEGLYKHVFKGNATDEHWNENKNYFQELFSNRDGDIRRMCGATIARLVSMGVYPPTMEWRSDSEKDRFIKLSPAHLSPEQRQYYAPQLEELRDEYIRGAGL
jgi:hypothetical protein